MNRLITPALFCIAGLGALWPVAAHLEEKPITIGFAIAQSGWMEPYDHASRMADFAIEDINKAGGLLGRKITAIYEDTKTDPAQGAKAALDLVDKGADLIIVSCDYDQGAPAAQAATNAGKIAFSLCAGDPKMGVEGVGKLAFTGGHAGQVQGATMAKWGYEKKNFRKAYVLLDNSIEFTKSVCQGFDYEWSKLAGTKVVGRDTFKNGDESIASQITRLQGSAEPPDVIMLCSFPPGVASAIRQMRAAGIKTPIMLSMACDGAYWLPSVPGLTDTYLPAFGVAEGPDPNPKFNELIERYKAKYKEAPATAYTFYGYSDIQLWAAAVKAAKTTESNAVAAQLEKLHNFDTVVGPMSFSADLHIQNSGRYLILGIADGKHQQYGYIDSPVIPKDLLFRH